MSIVFSSGMLVKRELGNLRILSNEDLDFVKTRTKEAALS